MSVKVHDEIWACTDCMLAHANGEFSTLDRDPSEPYPWAEVDQSRFDVAMGGTHPEECDGDEDCGCEFDSFSTARCEGCGSYLAGDRHTCSLCLFGRRDVHVPVRS